MDQKVILKAGQYSDRVDHGATIALDLPDDAIT